MTKPLGHKAYGSIPHLSGSRVGPGDYHCEPGQEAVCFNGGRNKKGQKHRVIVTEKLDGSNVAVAKKDGRVLSLVRAGYLAETSPRTQHKVFAEWVAARDWTHLKEGCRISGEWLYQAHGTIYEPSNPFVAFDAFDASNKRIDHDSARAVFSDLGIEGATVIHDGDTGMTIEQALAALGEFGFHGAKEQVEGAVWRVETSGAFNFLAKYVRHDKQDGKYFSQGEDGGDIFMCDPMKPE